MTATAPPFRIFRLTDDVATKGPVPESAKTTVGEAWTREDAWAKVGKLHAKEPESKALYGVEEKP